MVRSFSMAGDHACRAHADWPSDRRAIGDQRLAASGATREPAGTWRTICRLSAPQPPAPHSLMISFTVIPLGIIGSTWVAHGSSAGIGVVSRRCGQFVRDLCTRRRDNLKLRDPELAERCYGHVEVSLIVHQREETVPLIEAFCGFGRGHEFDCLNRKFVGDSKHAG